MISKRIHFILASVIVSIIGACSSTEKEKSAETNVDTVFIEKTDSRVTNLEILTLKQEIKKYEDSLSSLKTKLTSNNSHNPKIIYKTITQVDSMAVLNLEQKLEQTIMALNNAEELNKKIQLTNTESNKKISLLQNEIDSLEEELAILEDSLVAVQSELTFGKSNSAAVIDETMTKVDSAAILKLRYELNQTKNSLKEAQELVKRTQLASRNSTHLLQDKIDSLTEEMRVSKIQKTETTQSPEITILEKELSELKRISSFRIDSLKHQSDSLSLALKNLIASNFNQEAAPEEKIRTSSGDLSEAFRIYLEAKSIESSDPTLALKLMKYAVSLSEDSIITNYYHSLPQNHIFYENVIQNVAPIQQLGIGSDRLISVFSSGAAHYYSFENGRIIDEISTFDGISCADISERKSMILGRQNGTIAVYNINREEVSKNLSISDQSISSVGYIGNVLYFLAVGTAEKTVIVYDKKYNETATLVGMKYPVSTLSINTATGYLATACGDLNPRIWNAKGKLLLRLEDQSDSVKSVALSPSSKYLLTANADGKTRIWTNSGELKVKGPIHESPISTSLFLTDQLYATADEAGKILIWDNNGDIVHRLNGHSQKVTSLIFRDEKTLYSSSLDGSVKKWLLKLPQTTRQLPSLSEAEKKRFKIN